MYIFHEFFLAQSKVFRTFKNILFYMRRIWDTLHACGPMKQKEVGSPASFSIFSNHTRRVGTYIAEKFDFYIINV